jgi:hypothetical protein
MKTFRLHGIHYVQLLAFMGLSLKLFAQTPFSDTFTGPTLNPGWTLESPNPDSSYQMTGSSLNLTASWNAGGSDLYSGSNYNAPRLLQPVDPSADWIIETGFAFSPTDDYQGVGLLLATTNGVFPGVSSFNRISEWAYYPNGGGSVIRSVGAYAGYGGGTSYLRVQKAGTNYTGWWSADGINWTLNGTATDTSAWPYLGVFVIRYPWDGVQINSTAAFSYFNVMVTSPAGPSLTNYVPVSLAPVANAVNNRIANCLTGRQVLGGVPFNLLPATGNNAWDAIGNTAVGDHTTQVMNLPVNIYGATAVDTLINTSWGASGQLVPLTLTCSDGTSYTFNLTPGGEIRDWLDNVYVNAITNFPVASAVYIGDALAALPALQLSRVDKQHIVLPAAFFTRVLTNINLTDTGVTGNSDSAYSHSIGAQRAFVYGVTVSAPPVVLNIAPWTNSVLLSWNTNLTGFTLQASTNLISGNWTPVAGVPAIIGTQYFATNATSAQAMFYRLIHN